MTIYAPAKVNLALRILARRDDGYHEIETLMAPISLADEIDVEISSGSGIELACDDPEIPSGSDNLVWRATEAFQKRTSRRFSARIAIRKKIPHGAGLGGGSSDAAAVIKGLDRLCETKLPVTDLEEIAATLGSDAPFFIRSGPAMCRGRGEQITPVSDLPPARLLLLKPPFPVSTAWAYQSWSPSMPAARQFLGNIELVNDLEYPVFQKYLLLPVIEDWLLRQEEVSAAKMSGSGSTLFAVLKSGGAPLARRAKQRFGNSLWTVEATTHCLASRLL